MKGRDAWRCLREITCESCGETKQCGRWNWTNQMCCQSCMAPKPDNPIYKLLYYEGRDAYLANESFSWWQEVATVEQLVEHGKS